jgi:hypothetical protein
MRSIARLLALALLMSSVVGQPALYPIDIGIKPGNAFIHPDYYTNFNDLKITIKDLPARTINSITFRPTFRGMIFTSWPAKFIDIQLSISYDTTDPASMTPSNATNPLTESTYFARKVVNFPAINSIHSAGGTDVIIGEPHTYKIVLDRPYSNNTRNTTFNIDFYDNSDNVLFDATYMLAINLFNPAPISPIRRTECQLASNYRGATSIYCTNDGSYWLYGDLYRSEKEIATTTISASWAQQDYQIEQIFGCLSAINFNECVTIYDPVINIKIPTALVKSPWLMFQQAVADTGGWIYIGPSIMVGMPVCYRTDPEIRSVVTYGHDPNYWWMPHIQLQ